MKDSMTQMTQDLTFELSIALAQIIRPNRRSVDLLKEEGVDEAIVKKVRDIDTADIEKKHTESMDEYMQEEYIDGIVNAVESFNVEDMANMAENLVSITSLQRHFSSSDETVGGLIDVAVITRAEGFVWVRHKDFIKNLLGCPVRCSEKQRLISPVELLI